MNPITEALITSDGVRLHTIRWLPDQPRAGIFMVHGYGEHSGRYAHVAEALLNAGYAVYAIDHRAHGQSEGEPRAYVHTISTLVEDLRQFVVREQSRTALPSWLMLGHSMGALITWGFVERHPALLNAFISSGAPIDADADVSPLLLWAAEFMNAFAPTLPLADLAPASELTANPDVAPAFKADPLNYHGKLRVGTGVAINREAKAVRERLGQVTLPCLILAGENDRIVNPSGSARAFREIASTDKTLITYPGMKHEILNETDRAKVIGDILNWLETRFPQPAQAPSTTASASPS